MPVARFRREDGKYCIDIRLKTPRQLFDLRDPAPFRERDLDPHAAEYLLSTLEEIPAQAPVKLVISLREEGTRGIDPATLTAAIRGHFEYERDLVTRKIGENFRQGRLLAVIGIVVLATFLGLAELTASLPVAPVRQILREGLVITGWVAMWRPAEVLLYDWWPLYSKRKWLEKLIALEVEVRLEEGRRDSLAAALPD